MTVYCDHVFCQKPYPKRADHFYHNEITGLKTYLTRCDAHNFRNRKKIIEITEQEYLAGKVFES